MHADRAYDQNHNDDLSALPANGRITVVASVPSKLSKATISDPIYQDGIFRFSVTSQGRYT